MKDEYADRRVWSDRWKNSLSHTQQNISELYSTLITQYDPNRDVSNVIMITSAYFSISSVSVIADADVGPLHSFTSSISVTQLSVCCTVFNI